MQTGLFLVRISGALLIATTRFLHPVCEVCQMRFDIPSLLNKSSYLDYALVPVCLALWLVFGGWEWPASAIISLVAAYTKPLPRFHRWLLGRMTRSARSAS